MIYFDQAASSFPKPKSVGEAMMKAVNEYGANPGRGGHMLAEQAQQVIETARSKIATMFEAPASKHVWFYQNATMALNQALLGFPFEEGDHIVTTMYEHNSIIRPLQYLAKEKKVTITYVQPNEDGLITAEAIDGACTDRTKMLAITHASNVTGAFIRLDEIAQIVEKRSLIFLLDASQTAGVLPVQMNTHLIDLLAFAGHKSLLGPQGTGVLISRKDYHLKPLIMGGTGNHSELTEQPHTWPHRYEAGTLNTPGIAGLLAGIEEVNKLGLAHIYEHEQRLLALFLEGASSIENCLIYGPTDAANRLAVIPFSMKGIASHELAIILNDHYKIAVRAGVHCAPKIHQHLKTNEEGLVRVSFGPYNDEKEVEVLIQALNEIQQAFT